MNQVRKEILDTLLYIRKTKKEVQRTLKGNIAYNNGKHLISIANPVREQGPQLIKCSNQQDFEHIRCYGNSVQVQVIKDFVNELPEDAYLEFNEVEDYDGNFLCTDITAYVIDFESDKEYLDRLLRLKEDLDERLKRNSFKTRSSDDEVNLYIMHLEAKLDNKEK